MKTNRARLTLDHLEERALPAVSPLAAPALSPSAIYSVDGSGNNLANPTWGSTNTQYIRIANAEYGDGISTPAGADRPSARAISNALAAQSDSTLTNDRMMSAFVYAWGQFVDHDLDLTNTASPKQSFNIQVPTGDPSFDPNSTGTQVIPLSRSIYDATTGITTARQQTNAITTFLDGSMIYGSDATTAASLRTFSGGKMKTSDGNLLPTNADGSFAAGDVRANENPELMSLQTLFVREHNLQADKIAKANPKWTDEQIYQKARGIVIAEIQAITYNEFLPAMLGSAAPGPYRGYNPKVNPSISNEFATAGYRVGHTMVGDDIEFLDNNGNEIRGAASLAESFFNTDLVKQNGIDSVLKYLASDNSQEVDTQIVDGLRNFLFGPPGAGGLDLASLNIQRGRDHGLADYNDTRAAYGLPKVKTFADITKDPVIQQKLKDLYGTVDKIDLWVGGLAEDHLPGSSVGPTFAKIISDQFSRLRDGDRLWYQNTLKGPELDQIQNTHLADIIKRNTSLTNLQGNVFFFKAEVSGTVFQDGNGNNRFDAGEKPAPQQTVQLLDATTKEVLAETKTDAKGNYVFDTRHGLATGSFLVHIVPPTGTTSGPADKAVSITRGDQMVKVDFGLAPPPKGTTTPPPAPKPAGSTTPQIDGNLGNAAGPQQGTQPTQANQGTGTPQTGTQAPPQSGPKLSPLLQQLVQRLRQEALNAKPGNAGAPSPLPKAGPPPLGA
jgi:peroxidase